MKFDKDQFVGHTALREEESRGPAWQLVGLEVHWDSLEKLYGEAGLPPILPTQAWRTSAPVYARSGEQVGLCYQRLLVTNLEEVHCAGTYRNGSVP